MLGYRDGKSVVVCDGCHEVIGEAIVSGHCGPNAQTHLNVAELGYGLAHVGGLGERSWIHDPDDAPTSSAGPSVRVDHHPECGPQARTFRASITRAPMDDPEALDPTGEPV